jgi:hypothetical protein
MTATQTTSAKAVVAEFASEVKFSSVGRSLRAKTVQVSETRKLRFDAHHDKDSKVFRATVTVYSYLDEAWVVVLHTGFRGVKVQPSGRYSEKALRAFFHEQFANGALEAVVAKTLVQEGVA